MNKQPPEFAYPESGTAEMPRAVSTLESLQSLSYRAGELQPYMDRVCEVLLELLGDGLCAITLYRDGQKKILAISPAQESAPKAVDVHGLLSTHVVNNKAVLKVEDATENTQYGVPPEGFCSYMGVPLCLPSGEVAGTICYFNRSRRNYTQSDQQTAELFAERVAIALDNYEMFQQLEEHSNALETLVQRRTQQLLDAKDELVHKEKLAAVGEFATQLTHEIRNPLTTIRLTFEYLQKHPEKNAEKRVELAAGELSRLERLLNHVLLYARPAVPELSSLDLAEFCRDFIATYESVATDRQQQLILEVSNPVTVLADRDKLTQVLLNLINNACEASDIGESIFLHCHSDQEFGVISVHNKGAVIPESKLAHITEPFVSAKANGSGLGLAIADSLLQAQGGRLAVVSTPTDGTTVTVYVPRENK